MQKHLIIYANPNQDSFCHAVLEAVLNAQSENSIVRDLYLLDFNPILSLEEINLSPENLPNEIKIEQDLIKQADLITLIYPLWWMGFPAIMKGYFDRVLSFGFAYENIDGKSQGKLTNKMQQFIVMGNKLSDYQAKGFDKSLQDCLVDGLFNFCGIKDIQHTIIDALHLKSEDEKAQILQNCTTKTKLNLQ